MCLANKNEKLNKNWICIITKDAHGGKHVEKQTSNNNTDNTRIWTHAHMLLVLRGSEQIHSNWLVKLLHFCFFVFLNSERSRSNCPLCRERVAGSDDTWVLTEKPESSDYETDLKGYLVGLADRTTWAWHFVASFIFWLPDDRLQWDISPLSLSSCCPTDMSVIFSAVFLLNSMQKTSTVFFLFLAGPCEVVHLFADWITWA